MENIKRPLHATKGTVFYAILLTKFLQSEREANYI